MICYLSDLKVGYGKYPASITIHESLRVTHFCWSYQPFLVVDLHAFHTFVGHKTSNLVIVIHNKYPNFHWLHQYQFCNLADPPIFC